MFFFAVQRVTLRLRRLKWAQAMVRYPDDHSQMIAALFGRMHLEQSDTLLDDGSFSYSANNWAVQFVKDCDVLQRIEEGHDLFFKIALDIRRLWNCDEVRNAFLLFDLKQI